MVKLGREIPVASMDNSGKIIWAKHNEIHTVNIKSVGTDEVWEHFFTLLVFLDIKTSFANVYHLVVDLLRSLMVRDYLWLLKS